MIIRWLTAWVLLCLSGAAGQESSSVFNCYTMLPTGQTEADVQTSLTPALILTSNLTYTATQTITVTVASEVSITAFILEVYETLDNSSSDAQGTWSLPAGSPAGLTTFSCMNKLDTVIYIQPAGQAGLLEFVATWTPSTNTHGQIQYMATVITSSNKFWFISQTAQELVVNPSNPIVNVGYQLSLKQLQELSENNIQEQIMAYQLQQEQDITDELTGNEGDWSRTRELERKAQEAAQQQEQLQYEQKKAAAQQQQQQMFNWERQDQRMNQVIYYNPPPPPALTTRTTLPNKMPTIPRNINNMAGSGNVHLAKAYIISLLSIVVAATTFI